MKAGFLAGNWRPIAGAVCVGVAALGLSYQLEGAPLKSSETSLSRTIPATTAETVPTSHSISNEALWAKAGQVTSEGYPVMEPVIVDYKDDEPTRLRAAGLLHGALPLPSAGIVATGGCTYSIECEDTNPCTTDLCVIAVSGAAGSGKCTHDFVPAGEKGACDDGVFCNGKELCNGAGACVQGLPASCCAGGPGNDPPLAYCSENAGLCGDDAPIPGKLCASDADCGGKECQHCRPKCTNNTDSDDTSNCNGDESCDGNGEVVPGIPACGVGAVCSEKQCTGSPAKACNITEDCGAGRTCTVAVPFCFRGRCCPVGAEPDDCAAQKLSACPTPKLWWAGDTGVETGDANTCGGKNGDNPPIQLGCPKYSSGIVQVGSSLASRPVVAGPMSASTQAVPAPHGPGTALNRLGDDYSFNNNQPIELEGIRFVGYMAVPDAVFFEFWDNSGNFIEDFLFRPSLVPAVNQLLLEQPLVIPPQGRISVINKREFGLNSKLIWLSSSRVDEGTNNANILFVNNDPNAANFMSPSPGILAFEFLGRKVAEPLGGCCHHGSGECTNELDWLCEAAGDCVGFTCVGGINAGMTCSSDDECTGTFEGVGNYCNTCQYGENIGAACGRCSVGATPCNSNADCSSGTCVANTSVCNNKCSGGTTPGAACLTVADCLGSGTSCVAASKTCSNDASNTCTSGTECVARFGVCSNRDQGCTFSSDCPPGGICGTAGTCEAGVCAPLDACGVGACCSALGVCSSNTASGCSGVGGTYLGLGTTCEPNCCPQPYDLVADPGGDANLYDNDCTDGKCWTGADDCPDALIPPSHVVPALVPGDDPFVITISGNDAFATSTDADPDAFHGAATSVFSDRGWWERFTLTGQCTRVRLDLCCSTPTQFANHPYMVVGCDPSTLVTSSPDPYPDEQLTVDRGLPFCEEDNMWVNFGLVGPGTYSYCTVSDLESTTGPYQIHVVAEACPESACCKPDGSCIDGVNQLQCNGLGGIFLAQPQQYPATPLCSGDPGICATGSCCTGPGKCKDDVLGVLVNRDTCINTLGGSRYLGGIRCFGGTCADDPVISCANAGDCPTGACIAGGSNPTRSLAQENPCPICEAQLPGQCHLYDGNVQSSFSDLNYSSGIVSADDFIAGAGLTQINKVCVTGAYYTKNKDAVIKDCAEAVTTDRFRVRVLRLDGGGLPNRNDVVGSATATSEREKLPGEPTSYVATIIYGFQLTLTSPITGLVPGETYWLEVANNIPDAAECVWLWMAQTDNAPGNHYSMAGSDATGYTAGGHRKQDLAWCIDGQMSDPPTPLRPGCDCGGTCLSETPAAAITSLDDWNQNAVTAGVPNTCNLNFFCPVSSIPENDLCTNAKQVGVGLHGFSLNCAATDGLGSEPTDTSGNDEPAPYDVWYTFKARQNCVLRVDGCASGNGATTGMDLMIGVYGVDRTGTTTCPCPTTSTVAEATRMIPIGYGDFGQCGTRGCVGDDQCFPGAAAANGPAVVSVDAIAGACYTIRVMTWGGQRGYGILDISCGEPVCGDDAAQASLGEVCDGVDDIACPGGCNPPGDPNECKCSTPVCPNGIREGAEECDGADATDCPGLCQPDCTCGSNCGNNFAEPDEDCDGTDSADCPTRCLGNCTCPPKVCGNNFVDPGEECDGTDNANCGGFGCRDATDPAGECTCKCGVVPSAPMEPEPALPNPDDLIPNATGTKERYISFSLNMADAGKDTGLRVKLTSLHQPAAPVPPGTPSFATFQGQYRYVNLLGTGTCPDSAVRVTTVKCAVLSCTPEYRDWTTLIAGTALHVTGAEIVPDSTYDVSHLAASCAGTEASCTGASVEFPVKTARWGNVDGSGTNAAADVNVTDITTVVNKVKDLASGTVVKPRAQVQPQIPVTTSNVNVLDIANTVDAVKFKAYPFTMSNCP